MRWCYKRCTEFCSCYVRSCDCAACDLLLQVIFGKFRSRNCPQYFGTGPIDQGGTRHGGLLLGSRELLCSFDRISGTLVRCSSLSELSLPGESVSCRIQGESVGWWSISILSPRKTGGVFRGARHVTSTSCHPGARHVKSFLLTGTGTRHFTSLPSDRVSTHHVVVTYQGTMPSLWLSVGEFYLHRFNPLFFFRRRGFFPSPIHRIRHAHT